MVGSWHGSRPGPGRHGKNGRAEKDRWPTPRRVLAHLQKAHARPGCARHASPSKDAARSAHRTGGPEDANARSSTLALQAVGTLQPFLPGTREGHARRGGGGDEEEGNHRAFSLVACWCSSRCRNSPQPLRRIHFRERAEEAGWWRRGQDGGAFEDSERLGPSPQVNPVAEPGQRRRVVDVAFPLRAMPDPGYP